MVELECNSVPAFYTLKGKRFGRKSKNMMTPRMTVNHMGVSHVTNRISTVITSTNNEVSKSLICNTIQELASNEIGLHDIHMKFTISDSWTILSSRYKPNTISQDIFLPVLNTNNLTIRTTIHHTDTVTVVVGCSNTPIVTDTHGIIRLSYALTRVEERLSRTIDEYGNSIASGYETIPIPEHDKWVITLWHVGTDNKYEFAGEQYCVTWQEGQNALVRAYTKKLMRVPRKRCEIQERPNKQFVDAIKEKDTSD